MFEQITTPLLLSTFNQKDVDNWDAVDKNKKSFIIIDHNDVKYNRYPGFAFTNKEYAVLYYNHIYKNYIRYPTPPRGNLTECCEYVFIGIKPGTRNSDLSVSESAWLFGPTPEILNDLLLRFNIYPYFTNLQHDRTATIYSTSMIIREIEYAHALSASIKYVFMGNYPEYDDYIVYCRKLDHKVIRIWHPAYLYRNNCSEELINKWYNRFMEEIS